MKSMNNSALSVRYWWITVLVVGSILLATCGGNNNKDTDNATSGEIKISVDETFSPFMDSELLVFQSLYTNAKVHATFSPEQQAMKDLISDSIRFAVVSRQLNDEEKKYFENIKITPRITRVAIDAVALIVNNDNTDTVIKYAQLVDLFNGKVNDWKVLNADSKLSDVQIVFDNKAGSTARYIKEKFGVKEFPANCSAVNTNAEVVNYVAEHKNAIGVIGVNWISNAEDTVERDFLKKIQVMRIVTDSTGPKGQQPYQAYIARGTYPLTRNIYIVSREARSGLGTGFASFIAGDQGQRIILKSGLMPATMPVRIIGVH